MLFRFPVGILDNKFTPFLFRVILGGIFVYAAAGKILYPGDFAEAIGNYRIVPVKLTNLVAITLPWTELFAGLLLLNGFRTQSSNLVLFLCLCIFTFGVISAMVRGLDIYCGCFSESSRRVGLIFLTEEAALLAMSTCIFFFDKGFLSIDNLLHKYHSS
jgi:uncharacterized membrane protein YphA (DoxX/SURF4 family)